MNNLNGYGLAVQLQDLWEAGTILLPHAANEYAAASRLLNEAGIASSVLKHTKCGRVWEDVADQLQSDLAVSGDRLIETGKTMLFAMESYMGQDGSAARLLMGTPGRPGLVADILNRPNSPELPGPTQASVHPSSSHAKPDVI